MLMNMRIKKKQIIENELKNKKGAMTPFCFLKIYKIKDK